MPKKSTKKNGALKPSKQHPAKSEITKKVTKKDILMKKTSKKITKKPAVKKAASIAKKTPIITMAPTNNPAKKLKTVIVLALVLTAAYFAKNLFFVALVNGQPISRIKVVKELEKRQGKAYLDQLISEALIYQEASKKGIKIQSEDIDSEIAKLEENFTAQGSTLDQLLEMQGMSKEDLVKQIELQKIIEGMLNDETAVSEEEIDEYIESNKEIFPEDQDPDEIRENVKAQLSQQKMGEKFKELLDKLKEEAKINYFVKY